jgi:hypothetical protein
MRLSFKNKQTNKKTQPKNKKHWGRGTAPKRIIYRSINFSLLLFNLFSDLHHLTKAFSGLVSKNKD